jgi:hypothetical protein
MSPMSEARYQRVVDELHGTPSAEDRQNSSELEHQRTLNALNEEIIAKLRRILSAQDDTLRLVRETLAAQARTIAAQRVILDLEKS